MKTEMYKATGAKSQQKVELSEVAFGQTKNANLVHQVVTSMLSNVRQGNAHTKDRSEVSGTGKKPWQQKGTGRARHGSRRSPIWVGGGVSFGPRNARNYKKKINAKMKMQAMFVSLSQKFADSRVIMTEAVKFERTKDAEAFLKGMEKVKGLETLNTLSNKNNVCIVLPEHDADTVRALRNLPHVLVTNALNLNLLDVVRSRYIIVTDAVKATEVIASRHHTQETVAPSTTAIAETA